MRGAISVTAVMLGMLGWLVAGSNTAVAQPTGTVNITMSDGITLTTDLYQPTDGSPQPWPVILIRTPYGRDSHEAIANLFAFAGAGVVVQDVRGSGDSGGTPCVFTCDGAGAVQDGAETLDWIVARAWSNGLVATWGSSAHGITQYMLATTGHSALRAMWANRATSNFYDDALFPGGVFRQHQTEIWLGGHAPGFLNDIAAHPLADSFWDSVQTTDQYGDVQVPAVHVGGWYDIFAQSTLDAFVGYQHQGGAGAVGRQKLIMGPWTHGDPAQQIGELNFPSNSLDIPTTLFNLRTLWLRHYLGLVPNQAGVDAVPAVQYYVMGDVDNASAPGNVWRSALDWPIPAAPMRYYLHAGGTLATSCPVLGSATTGYTYNPANPSPTVGGANLTLPAGPYNQAPLVESRGDVVVFSTAPLTAPLEITGRVRAHLWVSIDTVDSDVMVRLTDVYPDGRSMLVLDAAARLASRGVNDSITLLAPGEVVEAVVDLWSTSIILDQGHRLRISVTSSNHERYRASPNDGSSYGGPESPQPVNVTLYHDADHLSYLEVPDPNRSLSDVTYCPITNPGDAGVPADAGGDAGSGTDAGGGTDAGAVDANLGDSAVGPQPDSSFDAGPDPGATSSGCNCIGAGFGANGTKGQDAAPALGVLMLLLALWRWRRFR